MIEAVNEAIKELEELLIRYDPIETISRIAVHVLTECPDIPRVDRHDKNEAHLEYLLSLAGAISTQYSTVKPPPEAILRVIELLIDIHMKVSIYGLGEARKTEIRDEDVASRFRMNQLHIRGDAYWPHLRKTQIDLLEAHDEKLTEALGFSTSSFFALMERTEAQLQSRLESEITNKIKPFRSLLAEWIHEPEEGISKAKSDPNGFAAYLNEHSDDLKSAKQQFDDYGSAYLFTISAETPEEEIILQTLKSSLGDNQMFKRTRPDFACWPLSDSIQARRPIIEHKGICYAFHLPQLLRGAYELIGQLLKEADPKYWERKFLKHRDQYLESETLGVFRELMPDAEIISSAEYQLPLENKKPEVDLVVAYDDVLLVVECKASAITPAANRGAIKSVKTGLRRTITSALNQAERLVSEMTRTGSVILRSKHCEQTLTLKAERFRRVIRINVTLEMLGFITSSLWMMPKGDMDAHPDVCWSLSLNDLRVIADILDDPIPFLHYVSRRLDINKLRTVEAHDELNYLMHYVEFGLFFEGSNRLKENESMLLSGFTENLDQYYRKVEGISDIGEKPRVKIGKNTVAMIQLLTASRATGSVSTCIELLDLDLPDREELLGKTNSNVSKLDQKDAAYTLSFTANYESKSGIAVACSLKPETVREAVTGRLKQHCKENGLEEIIIIHLGVPISPEYVHIDHAGPNSRLSSKAMRLLKQLQCEVTEWKS